MQEGDPEVAQLAASASRFASASAARASVNSDSLTSGQTT